MSQLSVSAQSAGGPRNQYTAALILVDGVRQEIQVQFPVAVTQSQIRGWIRALERAVRLIELVPVPLIYPPPAFAQYAAAAVRQIQQALAALRSPELNFRTFVDIVYNLLQAELLLLQAIATV